MEVNEEVQERNFHEPDREAAPQPHARVPNPALSPAGWLRLAYAFEYLIAVLTIFTVWSEIGGQGHLDLVPWYTKLACVLGLAWCCIRFTAGMVEHSRAWNRHSIGWFLGLIFLAVAMGSITYYYHLHEEPSDDANDTTAAITLSTQYSFQ
jgi:hypothetical protein